MQDISGGTVTLKEGEHLSKERTPEDVKNDAIIKFATEMYSKTTIGTVLNIKSKENLLTRVQSYILILREWPDFVHLDAALMTAAIFLTILAPKNVGIIDIDAIIDSVTSEIPKKKNVPIPDVEREIKFIVYRYWKLLTSLSA